MSSGAYFWLPAFSYRGYAILDLSTRCFDPFLEGPLMRRMLFDMVLGDHDSEDKREEAFQHSDFREKSLYQLTR